MKINCKCGGLILDSTDNLPHKAHLIPDQELDGALDAIDEAIERSGPSTKDKEAACMAIRSLIGRVSRSAWECRDCGRLYIDDKDRQLREFVPASEVRPCELFRSRPSDFPGGENG